MASKKDAVIMGTNSYSIVSKRSVEHLYQANDPQFLAEFVPQLKRRSPLINRGYWLRMKAVEDAVCAFIHSEPPAKHHYTDSHPADRTSSNGLQTLGPHDLCDVTGNPDKVNRRKLVINLGCGEDTMPFRMLEQIKHSYVGDPATDEILFIDIDYPDLMDAKAERVLSSELLRKTLNIENPLAARTNASISLKSTQYAVLGADLNNLESVTRQLQALVQEYFGTLLGGLQAEIMLIAEVSITYMPTAAADALLLWAAEELPESAKTFILLEQILPAGRDHPFAKTMLSHFDKTAPLQSVTQYPTLGDQRSRFADAGWRSGSARTLWDLWNDVDSSTREHLQSIEPFDEWEEFALFCSHYVFLIAHSYEHSDPQMRLHKNSQSRKGEGVVRERNTEDLDIASTVVESKPRRFGAAMISSNRRRRQVEVFHIGGYDVNNRLSAVFDVDSQVTLPWSPVPIEEIDASKASEAICQMDPQPFILRKQDLGPCTSTWHPETLIATGEGRMVTVHRGVAQSLTFTNKNFVYSKVPFQELVHDAVQGHWIYLRALADGNSASKTPASLQRDYPRLAADFHLPESLQEAIADEDVHSSVLRISGQINMWLHYDVMANVLCQVRGRKRVILFPPDDALRLGFDPGSTTSDDEVFGPCGILAKQAEEQGQPPDYEMDCDVEGSPDCSVPDLPTELAAFTITQLPTEPWSNMLVGGRTSPLRASSACWVLRGHPPRWSAIAALEPGRFRHCATAVQMGDHHGVLVFGGKTSGGVLLGSWHVHCSSITDKWLAPVVKTNATPCARFGAAICTLSMSETESVGWLMGGMDQDHHIIQDVWRWRIQWSEENVTSPNVWFEEIPLLGHYHTLARFGATLTSYEDGGAFLIGGVSQQGVLQPCEEVIFISNYFTLLKVEVTAWKRERPLLVGHSTARYGGKTVITGGGAVCFSFGSYQNQLSTVLDSVPEIVMPDCSHETVLRKPTRLHPQEVVLDPGDCLFIPPCWPHATSTDPTRRVADDSPDHHMSVAVNVFFKSLEKGYAAGRDVYGNRDLECYQNCRRDILLIAERVKNLWVPEVLRLQLADAIRERRILRPSRDYSDGFLAQSLHEITRIRQRLAALPDQLKRFYAIRLAAELQGLDLGSTPKVDK